MYSYLRSIATVMLAALSIACYLTAQDAVPNEIIRRTFIIKTSDGNSFGTAFAMDYKNKLYIVTARHVAAGYPETNAMVQIRRDNMWQTVHTVRILHPPSNDVDIAIFETEQVVEKPFEIAPAGKTGAVTLGQQVWFLGFPHGLGSRSNNLEFPFIKKGTMSAVDSTNPDSFVLYIDGFNNPGFSGGPILFWDFSQQKYMILGVVQGFKNENAKMIVNGQQVDTPVSVNSGILAGYHIEHACQAIEASLKQQN